MLNDDMIAYSSMFCLTLPSDLQISALYFTLTARFREGDRGIFILFLPFETVFRTTKQYVCTYSKLY